MTVVVAKETIEQQHRILTGNSPIKLAINQIIIRNGQRSELPPLEAQRLLNKDLRKLVALSEEIKR